MLLLDSMITVSSCDVQSQPCLCRETLEIGIILGFSCGTGYLENVHVSMCLGGLIKKEAVIGTRDDQSLGMSLFNRLS